MTTKKRTKRRTKKPKHTFHNEINVVIHNSKSKGGKSKGTKTNHSNVPYNQSLRAQTAFNNTPITIPAPPPRGENQNQLNDLALNYIRNQQPLILPPPPAQEMILPPSPPEKPKKRSTSNIRLVKDLVFSNSNNPAYLKTVKKMGDLKKIARDKYGISDELLKQMNSKNKNDYIDRYFGLNGGGGDGGGGDGGVHRPTTIINEETDAAESNDLLGQLDTVDQLDTNDLSFNDDFQFSESEPKPINEVAKKKRGGQAGSKRGPYKKRGSN